MKLNNNSNEIETLNTPEPTVMNIPDTINDIASKILIDKSDNLTYCWNNRRLKHMLPVITNLLISTSKLKG